LLDTLPTLEVIVVLPQASVAVAVPRAALISPAEGLHPSVVVVPPVVITGAVLSEDHVTVLAEVAVLPQTSLAVHVLVCEREQLLLAILPSLDVIVVLPQASVAVAVPRAALISPVEGLQPSVVVEPPVVITGAVLSEDHVTVLAAVAVLPQASITVHVLVCEREQLLLDTLPSLEVSVAVPHASVAVAVPSAAFMSPPEGLHPSVVVVPPVVITGAVLSAVHVIVLDAVAVLPQASIAVHVLVCVREQLLLDTLPSLEVIVVLPQASVAVAVPIAALISPAEGLHPSVVVEPPVVITGAVLSNDHVIVLEAVAVLPQASIAIHVLVCEREQLLLDTLPSLEVVVVLPQASVAVAVPSAALISPAEGLQPSVVTEPPVVITGAVTSCADQVTVLDTVAVLPQASLAVNVLVCEREQLLLDTLPSLEVIVELPQASVAVAVPSAAFMSPAEGLHPSVVEAPPVVITGAVLSAVHVTVLDAVAVLPQASIAVHVLVCEREQLLLVTLPSLEVIVVLPQASVAVAVPRAALISPAEGLHPSVVVVPPVVITGAVLSDVHVIVLDEVAVLPQASLAVHVLVCEREQLLFVTLPSLELSVGVPHASVAIAVPRAALISPAEGLHPSVVVEPPDVITGAVLSADHVIVLDAVAVLPQASLAVHVLV
jgi:hypothetical protein